MQTLPYDYCRCMGENCARKSECLRHAAVTDMDRNTPWAGRYCREVGRESEGFIAISEEEQQK
ncbi:hypothetical protein U5817_09795 [Aromatoleum evansii]|uniref:Uncharacterized protein n=1 Tax=Aromatoleum evansii TaxID=59406 RepID=A0ABZ1AR16_AROEV|nr:hypothetical protein U5817_09445 [Aromatoleum evansii]WRL48318.1 hypothetical protein U5817_09795 [Aromatoleum evansii]